VKIWSTKGHIGKRAQAIGTSHLNGIKMLKSASNNESNTSIHWDALSLVNRSHVSKSVRNAQNFSAVTQKNRQLQYRYIQHAIIIQYSVNFIACSIGSYTKSQGRFCIPGTRQNNFQLTTNETSERN